MKFISRQVCNSLFLVLLIAAASFTANAQDDTLASWKEFDFGKNSIQQAQIQKLELYELKLMRGLIFGRHGRVFKDGEINQFLQEQSWYKANPDFTNAMLNDTERRNLDLIRIAEAAKHVTIQPGDMRYWRDRAISLRKLGKHSGAEWKV
jgi:YARHG domain-containing protein